MDQEIKKLIKKNLELTRETNEMIRYIKKYVIIQQVLGVIKIIIIVIPLILGIIYLPPLLKDAFQEYQNLLGFTSPASQVEENISEEDLKNLDKEDVPAELWNKIKQ